MVTWLEEEFSWVVQLKDVSAEYRAGIPASSVESQHSEWLRVRALKSDFPGLNANLDLGQVT